MTMVARKGEEHGAPHQVTLVPPGSIEFMWNDVWHLLAPAVTRSHGRWTSGSLYGALVDGRMQLWLAFDEDKVIDAAAVTEVMTYPNRRMLAIHWLGGERFNEWVWDLLDVFDRFAVDAGCTGIEATARQGFWKWLSQADYEKAYVVYEKAVGAQEADHVQGV